MLHQKLILIFWTDLKKQKRYVDDNSRRQRLCEVMFSAVYCIQSHVAEVNTHTHTRWIMIHTQDDRGAPGVHTTPTNKHTREQHKKKTADIKTSLQRLSVSQCNYQPLIKHLLTRKKISLDFNSLPPPQSVQPEDLFCRSLSSCWSSQISPRLICCYLPNIDSSSLAEPGPEAGVTCSSRQRRETHL